MKIIDDDIKHIRTRFEEFARVLALNGYSVSYPKVGYLLRELGYSLQANRKMLEGTEHPDRNAQFRVYKRPDQATASGRHSGYFG